MKILILCLLAIALVALSGCTERGMTGSKTVDIMSGGKAYPSYLAAPLSEGKKPAIVLIHSFNGFEPGYRNLTDKLASDGFVVLSPQWQTFEQTPKDEVMEQLLRDSIAYLRTRPDVSGSIGLTGFCIGGRYTMLFLPQIDEFRSGVAWYGFPYRGGPNQSMPADMIERLKVSMLMMHGTYDQFSPVADIYRYASALNASGKYFELKVYQGQPHGFMIEKGELSQSSIAKDAYREMVSFFNRTLREN